MKKAFSTGLAILLPVFFTYLILAFIINFLTGPFQGFFQFLLTHDHFLEQHPWAIALIRFFSGILILVALFVITVLVGFLGQFYLAKYFLPIIANIVTKLPVIGAIYTALQEVVNTIFGTNTQSFSKVVIVPFPPSQDTLGLVAQDSVTARQNGKKKEFTAVFIPCAPNITIGLIVLYDKKKIRESEITPEMVFKCLVSCGATADFHMG